MATDKDIIKVISKLNRLTQEEKIEWDRMDPPDSLTAGTNDIIFKFYGSEYKGRNIGLYEERCRAFDESFDSSYWAQRLVLAFFSDDWVKEWEFPEKPGIGELLKSVEYQVVGVDTVIDEILKTDDKDEEDR